MRDFIMNKLNDYLNGVEKGLKAQKELESSDMYSVEYKVKQSREIEAQVEELSKSTLNEIRQRLANERKYILESLLPKASENTSYFKDIYSELRVLNTINLLEGLQDFVASCELEALAEAFKDNYFVLKYIKRFASKNNIAIHLTFKTADEQLNEIDLLEKQTDSLFYIHPVRENNNMKLATAFMIECLNKKSI